MEYNKQPPQYQPPGGQEYGVSSQNVQPVIVPVSVQQAPPPVIMNAATYGSDPMTVTCFHCRSTVVTRTSESPNALCCFLFGCWALCCPGCQDVEHRCPNCNVILGTYKP